MNKTLIESQEGVLYSTPPVPSVISMLSSAALQSIQNFQTLQRFLSPLYVNRFSVQAPPGTYIVAADKLSATLIKLLVQLVTVLCIL